MSGLIERMQKAGRPVDEIEAVRQRDELQKDCDVLLRDLNMCFDAGQYLIDKCQKLSLENAGLRGSVDELKAQLDRALPAVRK